MHYAIENRKKFEVCGIPNWWERGFTGKGIHVANLEPFDTDAWFLKNVVQDPFGNGKPGGDLHGTQVLDIIHQVAPHAILYSLPFVKNIKGGQVEGHFVDEVLPLIVEKIDIVGVSKIGYRPTPPALDNLIRETQKEGVLWSTAAGNEPGHLSNYAKSEVWISVGAVGLTEDGKIIRKGYSGTGEELDLVVFNGLHVHPVAPGWPPYMVEGTSFANPMALGMLAMVQQFFLEKTGQKLDQEIMLQFIKDHCLDLGDPGHDEKHGWGLWVLPDPNTIDVRKYVKVPAAPFRPSVE